VRKKFAPQFFSTPGGDEMVIIPRAYFEALVDSVSEKVDATEALSIMTRAESGEEEKWPTYVVEAIRAGENPIEVFRTLRQITQLRLAEMVGISSVYLSQVENGEHTITERLIERLAEALDVDADDLANEPNAADVY
jgi:plasmid maintenance system antidote protein VapI